VDQSTTLRKKGVLRETLEEIRGGDAKKEKGGKAGTSIEMPPKIIATVHDQIFRREKEAPYESLSKWKECISQGWQVRRGRNGWENPPIRRHLDMMEGRYKEKREHSRKVRKHLKQRRMSDPRGVTYRELFTGKKKIWARTRRTGEQPQKRGTKNDIESIGGHKLAIKWAD